MSLPEFSLTRNAFGRLLFTAADGTVYEGVVPVRAFPISAPEQGIAVVSGDGRELLWLESLDEVPAAAGQLLREELARREFMPEIRRIVDVSTFATPSTWQIETDRGAAELVLKGEEDIRRLNTPPHHNGLLIADSHGIQYLIRDLTALDRHSRKILDRFL